MKKLTPTKPRRETVFDERAEYASQKDEFAARAAELKQQGVTVLPKEPPQTTVNNGKQP